MVVLPFLYSVGLSGQNLHFAEILKIKNMDVNEAQAFLTKKDWKFQENKPLKNGNLISMVYSGKSADNPEATLLFNTLNLLGPETVILTVKTLNKAKYDRYMKTIKARGAKLFRESNFEEYPSYEYKDSEYFYMTFIESGRTPPQYNITVISLDNVE